MGKVVKAVVRLAGGDRFVDALADLNGVNDPYLPRFASTAEAALVARVGEFDRIDPASLDSAVGLLVESLEMVDTAKAWAAALGGPARLRSLVMDQPEVTQRYRAWTTTGPQAVVGGGETTTALLFDALLDVAADQIRQVLLSVGNLDEAVTRGALSLILQESDRTSEQLSFMEEQLQAIRTRFDESRTTLPDPPGHQQSATEASAVDAASMAEAVARTPEVSTGAAELLVRADERAATSPEDAAALTGDAQRLLRDAHFPGHAAALEIRRAHLLAAAGRTDDASRALLDVFWDALESGTEYLLRRAHETLENLAKESADTALEQASSLAGQAMQIYNDPLGEAPRNSRHARGQFPLRLRQIARIVRRNRTRSCQLLLADQTR